MGCIKDGYGFVHIPKCGGTSIRRAIPGSAYVKWWHHPPAREFPPELILFSQVRNPYPRMVSLYHQTMKKIFRHMKGDEGAVGKYEDGGFRWWLLHSHKEHPIYLDKVSGPINILPQSYYYEGCDHIFRLEDGDIWEFLKKLGVNKPRHDKKGQYGNWRDFYDDECRKFVARTFEEDIERFGYGFDISI